MKARLPGRWTSGVCTLLIALLTSPVLALDGQNPTTIIRPPAELQQEQIMVRNGRRISKTKATSRGSVATASLRTQKSDNGIRPHGVFPSHVNPAILQSGESWSFAADDGEVLQGRIWRPVRKPRAVLVALHGTQSHSGWYGDLATRLTAQGWAVYAPDRRGSGMNNPGVRKNLKPSPVHSKDAAQWLRDLDAAMTQVVEANPPNVPIYLMGSSWSTALCPAYVDPDPSWLLRLRGWRPKHASAVDGIILSVPAGLESRRPGAGQKCRTIAFGITGQVLFPLRKLHEKIDLPADTYSRHPQTRTLVGDADMAAHAPQGPLRLGQQDPLVVHRATYSFLLDSGVLRKAGKKALERLRRDRPDFPILSVLAEVDDIAVEPGKERVVHPGATTLPQTYHALQIERPDLLASAILNWHHALR